MRGKAMAKKKVQQTGQAWGRGGNFKQTDSTVTGLKEQVASMEIASGPEAYCQGHKSTMDSYSS